MGKRSRRKRLLWRKLRKEEAAPSEAVTAEQPRHEGKKHGFFYETYSKHYKVLMLFTLFLLFASLGFIGIKYAMTGVWINKDISLAGGISITVLSEKDLPLKEVQDFFSGRHTGKEFTVRKFSSGDQKGYIIETGELIEGELRSTAEALFGKLTKEQLSVEIMGSSLGKSFLRETGIALLLAFLFMSIIVLITFRNLVPSLFVILAAFSDIVCTFALTQLLGIKISTAGIAAFIMLIGYSIDTDILLTTRVLKREGGTVLDRTLNAMKTGITMTLTALVATVIGLILSKSSTLSQIFLIITIGLVFDILNTWLQNAGILRWYLEKHGKT
ncbi:MAG: protein translocase subunit SecF [Nanoarchaeota archaeon]